MIRRFRCYRCRKSCTTEGTEESAAEEYKTNFGALEMANVSLCDNCYEDFWEWAKTNAPELTRRK